MPIIETSKQTYERDLYNALLKQTGRTVEITLHDCTKLTGDITEVNWRARKAVTVVGGNVVQKDVYYVDIDRVRILD